MTSIIGRSGFPPTAACWQGRPAPVQTARRGACRPGMVLLVTIVCVAVGTAVMFAIVKQALLSRRQADLERYRAQALWLAESGVDRAAARLAADPAYPGEEWLLPAGDLGGRDAGRVSIRVEPIASEPGVFQVRVVADYPDDAVERARKSIEFRVRPRR